MTKREWTALLIIGVFVVGTATNLEVASSVFIQAKDYVVVTFDWFFTGVTSLCLLLTLWIGIDPRFNVRLGHDDDRPEFTNIAWFAMLFSAGLASGVLYWATSEPITHFQGNPHLEMIGAEPFSAHAAQVAVRVTIFHWGLHGWGLYVLTGLGIAYFAYRRGQPLALRSALYPLLGEHVNGWPGAVVDLIGVIGTVFGVATSIGLAVAGMNAAMSELSGIAINTTNQLIIVALVVGLGILSVISGVSRGIRRLSEINVWLSALLLVTILIVGPTAFLLGFVVTSLGDYATSVIPMGFWTANNAAGQNWQGAWTVFYWGWWLAWTPFVGLFIARISRGRTVREFVLGVMLVPTLSVIVWMSVFGGLALHGELTGQASIVDQVNADYAVGTVAVVRRLGVLVFPLVLVITFLLFTWLVTSIDSATLVICTLLKHDDANIPALKKVTWGVLLGIVTGLLIYVGGVTALQAASIVTGLPIGFLVVAIGIGVVKDVRKRKEAA
ncbi:MAG: BCCT family transporter [Gammaproteobacteria bacterium]|nr:BCCT family transporter [Gammaproteobacteria bacterium]